MRSLWSYLTLFASLSTLLCCAVPAFLVAIGLGASLAGLLSVFPQLVWFSEHKELVFSVAGTLLIITGYRQFFLEAPACPTDETLAKACALAQKTSKTIYVVSFSLFLVGVFFAFIAEYIL